MGSPHRYGMERESLLMFPIPNHSEVCSTNSDCHMLNDMLPVISVGQ